MITVAKVSQFTHEVTSEQIGRCHASVDANGTYYMVGSESGEFDQDGELVEYRVSWSKKLGFTCSCKAGQVGCTNCKRGFCKHILWSLACALEVRAAVKAMEATPVVEEVKAVREHYLEIAGHVATDEEYNRVMNAKPAPVYTGKGYASKPFSLMR